LDGNSHCSTVNFDDFNATTAITVEAWIRRDLTSPTITNQTIISKASSQGGGRTDYHLKLMGTTLAFDIGSAGTVEYANAILDDKWYHVAGTYNSADGISKLYIDGKKVSEITTLSKPAISNNPDSLYIGRAGTGDADLSSRFKGWIDEVRIWKNVARTEEEIKSTMYSSRSYTDGVSQSCTFGFDQFTNSLTANGSGKSSLPLIFWGNAKISSPKTQTIYTAPMIFPYSNYEQHKFTMSTKKTVITPGTTVVDSVLIPGTSLSVDNLVVLVLLNHGAVGGLTLTLIGPTGFSTNLTPTANTNYTSHDLIAILDQSADSTIKYTNTQLAPFSPIVKPAGNLLGANGTKANGWWKLRITDASTGNMLRVVNSWGIYIQTSTKVEYTVAISSSNTNYGTVNGGGTFFAGSQVTVYAAPKIGYQFINWTEGATVVSTNMNYSFTLNANRTLIANFDVTPSLAVTPDFVNVPSTAGTGTFNVSNSTGGTMAWTALSSPSWLSITSGTSGTNSGTINFSYQANTGVARIGKITVTSTGSIGSPKDVEVRQALGVGIDDLNLGIPETYVLAQNYPNPFNPATTIRYGLPNSSHVRISVYDIIGNEVARLTDEFQTAGYHKVSFDLNKSNGILSTGVYFYKISAGTFTQVKKMVVIK
jgi:subtilisin-like proprotein convertase family protein